MNSIIELGLTIFALGKILGAAITILIILAFIFVVVKDSINEKRKERKIKKQRTFSQEDPVSVWDSVK